MTATQAAARFGALAPTLAANGYEPVPLYWGRKNPSIKEGWQKYRYAPGDEQAYANDGVGIITGGVVIVDVDVYDAEVAAEIDRLLVARLGPGLLRIGAPPKLCRVYRCVGPEFGKRDTGAYVFDRDPKGAKGHKVEILARGQQCVAFNRHPDTQQPYLWPNGSPETVATKDLPAITDAKAFDFIAAATQVLAKYGKRTQDDKAGPTAGAAARDTDWIVEPGRNKWLTARAGHHFALGLRGDALLRALQADNEQRCRPPLDDKELRVIARSAGRNFKEPPDREDLLCGVTDSRVEALLRPHVQSGALIVAGSGIPDSTASRVLTRNLSHCLYRQEFDVVEVVHDAKEDRSSIALVKDKRLVTIAGRRRRILTVTFERDQPRLSSARLPTAQAAIILEDKDAITEELEPIRLVLHFPIAVEHDDQLVTLQPGYNAGCGIYVHSKESPPEVALPDAVSGLLSLLAGFHFTTDADKARAVASLVLPGLVFGGFVEGHVPVIFIEGNTSQAGKTLVSDIQPAIYGERRGLVTQKVGGVGSLDEAIGATILRGSPFVSLDNFRGALNSTFLEAIITAGKTAVPIRVPYRGEVLVPINRVVFQITSNGVDLTTDLANRVVVICLVRREPGFKFAEYPEGGLLQHVRANRSHYYGCVLAVLRHWFQNGKPRKDVRHTFAEYLGALEWIVQEVFQLPPLLAGHESIVHRLASPEEQLMRKLALEVERSGKLRHWFSATGLVELAAAAAEVIAPAGGWSGEPHKQLGIIAGKYFKDGDVRNLGHLAIKRGVRTEFDRARRKQDVKRYCVWLTTEPEPRLAETDDHEDIDA